MNILIAGLVKGSQATRLIEEGTKLGHAVHGIFGSHLVSRFNGNFVDIEFRDHPLKPQDYDIVYLKLTGKTKFDWYLVARHLHDKFGLQVVPDKYVLDDYTVFYSPQADYLKQAEDASLKYPKSVIFKNAASLKNAIKGFEFPLILKLSGGSFDRKGRGVKLVSSLGELKALIKEHREDSERFTLREFIPNNGDLRVFTVGYKAIGAMKRTPKEGDFRSNISQGGDGEEFDLSTRPDIVQMAEKLSKITRTEVAGVDIMLHKETGEPYILEINPGPQFEGLEKYTKVNAAKEIIRYFESKVKGLGYLPESS
ncbi:ATP-grasp domain-containing protein [bacterium]|nr:ATP-grasp domain-containing protein [bacterium]